MGDAIALFSPSRPISTELHRDKSLEQIMDKLTISCVEELDALWVWALIFKVQSIHYGTALRTR